MPYRFTAAEDIVIFTEALSVNPFQFSDQDEAWVEIAINVAEELGRDEPFKSRTLRNRVNQQIIYHQTDNQKTLKKSGTAEQYTKKREKLQQLLELRDTWESILAEQKAEKEKKQKDLMSKLKAKEKAGKSLRAASMKNMVKAAEAENDSSSDEGEVADEKQSEGAEGVEPKKKKTKRVTAKQETMSIVEMLKVKSESEKEAKRRELDQEDKRLAMEERRLALQEMQFRAANPHLFNF